jgi:8-amino-7-oxononanoate synthase
MTWSEWLAQQAVRRDDAGLRRTLLPRGRADGLVDLAGNDYLGLARDPVVVAAAAAAAQQWGAGAGASRLVTGTLDLHVDLEHALAAYAGQPAALVTSSGYAANLAVVTALVDRECLVVSDAHIHASLVDAVRLSKAEVAVVPHSDVAAVRQALATANGRRALVLAESIYSVLGDEGPLVELAEVCAEHGALLVVDEAHGLGVHGPGVVHRLGLAGLPHVVVTLTLSKSLGSQGGAVLGPPGLIDHLVNAARPFIFDTALAPAAAGAALAALGVLRDRPGLPALVRARVEDLAAHLGVDAPQGAVVSLPMPSPRAAVAAQAAARAQGVLVGCFRPPSVPDGVSRLRITVSAGVTDEDWARAVTVLVGVAKDNS